MKLYYFTSYKNAVDNLKNQHIKISLLKDVNDPYEVSALRVDRENKKNLVSTELLFSEKNIGLICFSSNYDCPLMWAHYAEKHSGVCLVLEINKNEVFKVKYSKKLLIFNNCRNLGLDDATRIVSTKYYKWRYEKEYRIYVEYGLSKLKGRHYFESFSENIKLIEVILGYKCVKKITKEMKWYPIFKANLTNNFKIIKKPEEYL